MATGVSSLSKNIENLKISGGDINILLLGETGVGKSTFINSLVNYLTYSKDFEAVANEGKMEILIPAVVTVEDKQRRSRKVFVGTKDENEVTKVGDSATQDVRTYVFPISDYKINMRLIDTPGMGDTRGIKQDDVNSENILDYISRFKELHAICFLFKPDLSRSTVFFQYCIAQIFSRLDKSACNNIIFVFTGTRGANYGPGDTINILRRTVDEIANRAPYIKIPMERNVFCFENESFKYLAATKEKIELSKEYRDNCKESWKKSVSECKRLLNYIVGDAKNKPLEPHIVKSTNAINEARRMIVQLAQPLADITDLINHNMSVLQRHEDVLKMDNMTLGELKKNLYMPVINLEVIKQTQPVTVCTSRHCAEIYKVGDKNKWHYKQRCHDPCYLNNVPKEIIGSPELAHCAAIDRSTGNCQKCSCNFSIHMHIYYMTQTKQETIQDDSVAKNIDSKEKVLAQKMILIGTLRRRKDEFEQEYKTIVRTCAKFAHFLENNAITPFNDSYKSYIEYVISREKSLGNMCNMETVRQLERLLREYAEAKKFFVEAKNRSQQSDITSAEVLESVNELFKLKHNGKKLEELCKCQNKAKKKEYKDTEYVHKAILKKDAKKQQEKSSNKKDESGKRSDKNQSRHSDGERSKDYNRNRGSSDQGRYINQETRRTNYSNPQQHVGYSQYPSEPWNYPYASGPDPSQYQNYGNPVQPNASPEYGSKYSIHVELQDPTSNYGNYQHSSSNPGYHNPPPNPPPYSPSYTPSAYPSPLLSLPTHPPPLLSLPTHPPPLHQNYGHQYSTGSRFQDPQGYGSYGNHAQWHPQSSAPPRQRGNRHEAPRSRGGNPYRGGRGRQGINKNYRSENWRMKSNNKKSKGKSDSDSDSDSDSSSSSN